MPITDAEGLQQLVAPAPDPVTELLEQLVTNYEIACVACGDAISRFEMFCAWPLAGVVVHMACYAGGRRLEATS